MNKSPILFWALHFLIGCGWALYPHWIYLLPLITLSFLSKQKLQALAFVLVGFLFTTYQCPKLDFEELQGEGIFCLTSIHPSQSPFSRAIALKGTFKTFQSNKAVYHNIPCTTFQNHLPPEGDRWFLKGRLQKKGSVIFKPQKNVPWTELSSPVSLARWRFQAKNDLRKFFQAKIADKKAAHFFSSMATGDPDDRLLSMEFRKVGLSHLLAISGFHFALMAALIHWILHLFMNKKSARIALLVILSFYFMFLGVTPSILRAFIMITLYIIGRLLHRKIDILNLLGVALLVELIGNPRILTHVGFQLSFLATLGILLFYPFFNHFFERFFPKRSLSEVLKWPQRDQYGYLISSGIRQALALSFAVQCATLPALLFLFHSFSFLSFPYNLIFPPLFSLSLLLLPLSLLIPPLRLLNEHFTSWLLRLLASPPELLN